MISHQRSWSRAQVPMRPGGLYQPRQSPAVIWVVEAPVVLLVHAAVSHAHRGPAVAGRHRPIILHRVPRVPPAVSALDHGAPRSTSPANGPGLQPRVDRLTLKRE